MDGPDYSRPYSSVEEVIGAYYKRKTIDIRYRKVGGWVAGGVFAGMGFVFGMIGHDLATNPPPAIERADEVSVEASAWQSPEAAHNYSGAAAVLGAMAAGSILYSYRSARRMDNEVSVTVGNLYGLAFNPPPGVLVDPNVAAAAAFSGQLKTELDPRP